MCTSPLVRYRFKRGVKKDSVLSVSTSFSIKSLRQLQSYFGSYSAFNEENIPLDRALSVKTDESAGIPQFVMDFRFEYQCAREMPVRNIPAGLYSGI